MFLSILEDIYHTLLLQWLFLHSPCFLNSNHISRDCLHMLAADKVNTLSNWGSWGMGLTHWMVLALSFLLLLVFLKVVLSHPEKKTHNNQKMKVCDTCWEIKHVIIICCLWQWAEETVIITRSSQLLEVKHHTSSDHMSSLDLLWNHYVVANSNKGFS